jgi:hypothetical protein
MTLARLVYYSGIFSGWAAFFGWLAGELFVLRGDASRGGWLGIAVVGGMVGAAIGAGLTAASAMGTGGFARLIGRMALGAAGGGIGGLVGMLIGNAAYASIGLPRFVGFMVLGLAVGVVDGLADRSWRRIRNGIFGGLLGGMVGGLLFNPLVYVLASDSGIASRAAAFVILGLCLGALIGLTQVVLREAWLTVVDGYRTGRQLIISRPVTVLGRGDHLPLPFLGPGNRDLEIEHCRITRQANGSFLLEDLQSRLGVFVNQQRVQGSRELASGDMIKLGPNHIRFQESRRRGGTAVTNSVAGAAGGGSKIPPPPPPPPPPRRPATDSLPNSASASGPASASGSASPSGPASPSPLVNASPANAPAVKPPSGRPPPPGSQPPGANSGR